MTTEEFKTAFPVGSLISYVPGMQFLKARVRDFFKIEGYTVNPKGHLHIKGVWCGFDFQTTHYKKEYTTDDPSKWHCIDCIEDVMQTSVGTLCHNFNDVRLADEKETSIFNFCLEKMQQEYSNR